jgi:hypothetical protein
MKEECGMARPEGWEWLDEPRPRWETPEALRGPVGSVPVNLALALLSCDFLGHEIRVLVGRFVSEHSLFYLRAPGMPLTFRDQALISDAIGLCVRRVFEAWEEFRLTAERDARAEEIGRLMRQKRQALAEELENAISVFKELPGNP